MQINSINSSINFNAFIGTRLKQAIDRHYPSIFGIRSKGYKNTIKKIEDSAPKEYTIEMEKNGDIYIKHMGPKYPKIPLNIVANYINGNCLVDEELADKIVDKVKEVKI